MNFRFSFFTSLTIACFLTGCPEADDGMQDAGDDQHDASDVPPDGCDVAGTYDLTWTAADDNAAGCQEVPGWDTVEIDAEGFDPGSPPCPTNCTTTCTRVPVSAGPCTSSAEVSGPCAALPEGQTVTVSTVFGDGDATVSITRTGEPGVDGVCSYTASGIRR